MYEHQTVEAVLKRLLDRVPNDIDKREGGIIYDALAPAAEEIALLYEELDGNYDISNVDTATGEYLSRLTAEFGVNRQPATKAVRKGLFYNGSNAPVDVPIGSRYSIDTVNFIVVSKISTGIFTLQCEVAGVIGNQKFGALLPIDYVTGLARAELSDVLVPGEDEESDDALKARYYEEVNRPAFGGNVADYKKKINAMSGVGQTKVFPVWNGGGTVKCTIIAADWNEPSTTLVDTVQTAVDPIVNSGQGLGTAPIDHRVTVTGVQGVAINVVTTVTLDTGVTVGQVQTPIEDAIEAYLLGLRKDWAKQQQLIVRVALIEAAILTVSGVIDVNDTTLNGTTANATLTNVQIPKIGTVTVNE